MSSLYAQYIKEREGKEILETDKGFATFTVLNNGECYIQDIYVLPDHRQTGAASEMAARITEIAKSRDCHTLVGSVCVSTNNPTTSLKVLLAYGFKLHSVQNNNMIFLTKDLRS